MHPVFSVNEDILGIMYDNILDILHRPSFFETQRFRECICLRPQVNQEGGGVLLWWVP
jgi:hypothetical protein